MKKHLILILLFTSSFCFSQTQEETLDWITRNSEGREQAFYDENNGKLLLLSVRQAGMEMMVGIQLT